MTPEELHIPPVEPHDPIRQEFRAPDYFNRPDIDIATYIGQLYPIAAHGRHLGRARITNARHDPEAGVVLELELGPDIDPTARTYIETRFPR